MPHSHEPLDKAVHFLFNKKGCHYLVHQHKVTEASTHHEEMEDFMGAEVTMPAIKYWQLQCINNTTDGINNASD